MIGGLTVSKRKKERDKTKNYKREKTKPRIESAACIPSANASRSCTSEWGSGLSLIVSRRFFTSVTPGYHVSTKQSRREGKRREQNRTKQNKFRLAHRCIDSDKKTTTKKKKENRKEADSSAAYVALSQDVHEPEQLRQHVRGVDQLLGLHRRLHL
jgi:hypothetical protein